ncbi:pirin family protein [Neisseria sp. 23W00296]|uniref:pirin family protein n=1 Tax=unclassified Neisseria TaxID=2623750 RepID=UPI0037579BE0
MRSIKKIYNAPRTHWVGDGFKVAPLFSHMGEDKQTSPFLMFDYAAPMEFSPNSGKPRGVGGHPHRGFETVTIAYSGEVSHRDSSGGGTIRQGDVQWMTAGSGIVHEEFHSPEFSAKGGSFEMAQLWVNLPHEHKRTAPRYQHLPAAEIPVVADEASSVRVIAGEYQGRRGAADTFTELNVWDVTVNEGAETAITVPAGHNLAIVVRHGEIELNGEAAIQPTQLAVFEREEGEIRIRNSGSGKAEILLLSGEPIDEPIAAYGPFVMNTQEELAESIREFNAGKYGYLD